MEITLDSLRSLLRYDPQEPLLFNSGLFLFLFLAFLGGYILLQRRLRLRLFYVFCFSLFFYYKSSGIYFLLLILSTLIDFYLGLRIHQSRQKGRRLFFLVLSLLANLGILGYFKYTNFFLLEVVNPLLNSSLDPLDIFLPVGISFYTFQTMSYSIDVYRGKLEPVTDLLDFAFFVSFFPQLVAGPIVRAAEFIPQIRRPLHISREHVGEGLLLICGGLFKKAVISDYIGINFVDRVFENPSLYSGLENLLGIYGYALQIYCDFSGYSDMAIGIGLLLGFRLPENFRTPYQAASLQDFWRRWHISLSTWLRDYLYISLGGNRKGKGRTYLNLMITMLLGGLWHGADWKFVFWGGMHGLALAVGRLQRDLQAWLKRRRGQLHNREGQAKRHVRTQPAFRLLRKSPGILLTFHFVCFCWIFFRAESFDLGMEMLYQIAYAFRPEIWRQWIEGYPEVLGLILLGYLLHFMPARWDRALTRGFVKAPALVQSIALALIIWLVIQTRSAEVQPFIYFQF